MGVPNWKDPLLWMNLALPCTTLSLGKHLDWMDLTEFYKKFWHLLGPELIKTLNASCQLGELPQSCRRALLTLIPKKGDMLRIENWRPISLLCTDYKIFSKALASRLAPYLSSLLKKTNVSVPKRSIYDNISLVRDIIELCKESPKDLGLLLLDQEKAFDRVDHRYLFDALLTLIPKKGDMLRIENWRPISLLCTDYKIFSKALASRLAPYLSSLLKEDQCYCVPKRSIYDNISLVRDIIELCKESPKDLGLLLLDQEKAFDRVDHRYLFEVLERFGLGSTFISSIKILYNNIYSVLKINNELVAPLSINKGIRQGCPLSGLLYALSIEPLLVSVHCRLTGVSLSQLERPIKVLAYADDVCVFVQDINDVNIVRYCLSLFEKASSAKVNWNKTSALWLGPLFYLAPRLPAPLSWANDGVKYLGVFLGNNPP
uniref:Reverse transcriptase domain-containing protein n=1 Tax=Eptatretus burgeri TaxID=7764 RepID=A0A8C4WRH2_EPTBU